MTKEEMKRTNEADIALQDKVRENPESCDHIGFYTPLGHDTFPLGNLNFMLITSSLCMMCGSMFTFIKELENPNKPMIPKKSDSKIIS